LAERTPSLFGILNIYNAAEGMQFYQVPFPNASELVHFRRAYLEDGMVYVSDEDFNTIIVQKFRTRLTKTLTVKL
jgi:DNA primase large subunit